MNTNTLLENFKIIIIIIITIIIPTALPCLFIR